MRYHFEDWTPLFREPCPSRASFAVEIPVSVVEEYRQAKEALIRASEKLKRYDSENSRA